MGMKQAVIGILAHVDSGKTTLSEGMLYLSGAIRKLGRVDHGDAFLDTYALERERGITIFSKQAVFTHRDTLFTLLDTPGHVDFSAETERTLQVLDYAVLVISGSDGVQGHTKTLWQLLSRHRIPTFLFINKMDLAGTDPNALIDSLKRELDGACVSFSDSAEIRAEQIALCDETLLERFLDGVSPCAEEISRLIAGRRLFPCYFGSALKLTGVEAFLDGLSSYIRTLDYPAEFGARVYKIMRDEQGNRLTCMKITGGVLKVRSTLSNRLDAAADDADTWEEKVTRIRVYSGTKYQTVEEAPAGTVCAVAGLTRTIPGEGLGFESQALSPVLEPVLSYRVILPPEWDVHTAFRKLCELEEEDPQLHVVWNEQLGEITLQLMGEVQLEVLTRLVKERFGMAVAFGEGSIVYKETIAAPVEGAGHFEPLRHYAEVHLLLEPAERGSGLSFASQCSEDTLDKSWQRLILTHLEEKTHKGVLTGSPITDMKITLIAGRAHLKHTEGGDFRQATYRAVRQGLKKAQSVLLEPYYTFCLELPTENVGRAMSDLTARFGTVSPPQTLGDTVVLTGKAPVSAMRGYAGEVTLYTRGRGRLTCTFGGYAPCHNAEEVVRSIGYDSDRDTENTADSVFCSHGSGFVVKWDEADAHMHISTAKKRTEEGDAMPPAAARRSASYFSSSAQEEKELAAIFARTYGAVDPSHFYPQQKKAPVRPAETVSMTSPALIVDRKDYLLVDGYNIIFAWDELKALAARDLHAAREALIHILSNYQGVKKCELILVFDAYKVRGGVRSVERIHNISVVYTKEAETADMYIEKVTYEVGKKHRVKVATSDALEQMIILGHGAVRLSANDLKWDIEQVNEQIREFLEKQNG